MIEKIQLVRNPLTIIAIFAAIAEIASTSALFALDASLQGIFVWFVMAFPCFLVACFFLTLNFNPRVLYAPSDYESEETFLQIMDSSRRLTNNLQSITGSLNSLESEILDKTFQQWRTLQEEDRKQLTERIDSSLRLIREQVEQTRRSAQTFPLDFIKVSTSGPEYSGSYGADRHDDNLLCEDARLLLVTIAHLADTVNRGGRVTVKTLLDDVKRDRASILRDIRTLEAARLISTAGLNPSTSALEDTSEIRVARRGFKVLIRRGMNVRLPNA